jgi:glycosyltransferase involved in cell wall biosynthesis
VNIVHGLAQADMESVDGASNSVRMLAAAQVRLGHDVTVILQTSPHDVAGATAAPDEVRLVPWTDGRRLRQLRSHADVVHLHSAFSPRLNLVDALLRGPACVVASPRGAVAPTVLRRGAGRKSVYSAVFDRPRLRRADGVIALSAAESADVVDFVRPRETRVEVIPNPIDLSSTAAVRRTSDRVVYLGRFDVLHKGLDRLVSAARQSSAEFHLYGNGPLPADLLATLPANVYVHGPVFGAEKAAVLRSAALYVQASRWEAFGRSIAEAAAAGTPLLVSSECDLAGEIAGQGCGVAVNFDCSAEVAARIDSLLLPDNSPARVDMSSRAAQWAARSFSADAIGDRVVSLYSEILASRQLSRPERTFG